MAGSSFGTLFRVTTFGESHCRAVGAVVEGVPPGLCVCESDIQPQLNRRRPGQSRLTTPREESDVVTILSGTEAGRALGTPIALMIPNENVRPGDYAEMLSVPRPGHADYTYQVKYGIRASSGGGRSSARETAARVAAGAIAEKWLAERFGTHVITFVDSVGDITLPVAHRYHASGRAWTREEIDERGRLRILRDPATGWKRVEASDKAGQAAMDRADEAAFVATFKSHAGPSGAPLSSEPPKGLQPAYVDADGRVRDMFGGLVECSEVELATRRSEELVHLRCPDPVTAARIASLIRAVKADDDSIGGSLFTVVTGVPIGLGEPVFDKLEAKLAHAMLSLPATKAFEIGSGFAGTRMRGSQHNDLFEAVSPRSQAIGIASAAGHGQFSEKGDRPDTSLALLRTRTNHAGGTLGGISSGANLEFRVAIKPVSTIGLAQATATYGGEEAVLEAKGRHDPCVLPRAPPLVEAMAMLVLADLALIQSTRGTEHGSLAVLPPRTTSAAVAEDGDKNGDANGRKRPRMAPAAAGSSDGTV